jgi:hypothetical protein
MSWHFRGSPHYLSEQGRRLGLSTILVSRAASNPVIHKASVLLGQLCERWHKLRVEDGHPVIGFAERAQVRAALLQCELESDKLHALAATMHTMLDEAWAAYELPPPERYFRVSCDYDDSTAGKTAPAADGRPYRSGFIAIDKSCPVVIPETAVKA